MKKFGDEALLGSGLDAIEEDDDAGLRLMTPDNGNEEVAEKEKVESSQICPVCSVRLFLSFSSSPSFLFLSHAS